MIAQESLRAPHATDQAGFKAVSGKPPSELNVDVQRNLLK